jgi:hypothetical protein
MTQAVERVPQVAIAFLGANMGIILYRRPGRLSVSGGGRSKTSASPKRVTSLERCCGI